MNPREDRRRRRCDRIAGRVARALDGEDRRPVPEVLSNHVRGCSTCTEQLRGSVQVSFAIRSALLGAAADRAPSRGGPRFDRIVGRLGGSQGEELVETATGLMACQGLRATREEVAAEQRERIWDRVEGALLERAEELIADLVGLREPVQEEVVRCVKDLRDDRQNVREHAIRHYEEMRRTLRLSETAPPIATSGSARVALVKWSVRVLREQYATKRPPVATSSA